MFLINIAEFIYFRARIILNLTIGFNNGLILAFTPFLLLNLFHASERRIENSEPHEIVRVVTCYLNCEYDKISNISKIRIVEKILFSFFSYMSTHIIDIGRLLHC